MYEHIFALIPFLTQPSVRRPVQLNVSRDLNNPWEPSGGITNIQLDSSVTTISSGPSRGVLSEGIWSLIPAPSSVNKPTVVKRILVRGDTCLLSALLHYCLHRRAAVNMCLAMPMKSAYTNHHQKRIGHVNILRIYKSRHGVTISIMSYSRARFV